MDIRVELDRLADDIRVAELEIVRAEAKLAGLQAERETLQRALVAQSRPSAFKDGEELLAGTRTDAIEAILLRSSRPLEIGDVASALDATGRRGNSYAVVAATLQQMIRYGRVERVGRNQYVATARRASARTS